MIEKGGRNLGRARVGRFDEDNELRNPEYPQIGWIVKESE